MSFGLVVGAIGGVLFMMLVATTVVLAGLGISFWPLGLLVAIALLGSLADQIQRAKASPAPHRRAHM